MLRFGDSDFDHVGQAVIEERFWYKHRFGTAVSEATRKSPGRSSVTNGRRAYLPENASELRKARRYMDVLSAIVSDLGGEDRLSEAQRQLCRRAVTLSLQCEHWDAAAAEGAHVDWDLYSRTTNMLRRLLESIGLERKMKPADQPLSLNQIAARIKARKQSEGKE